MTATADRWERRSGGIPMNVGAQRAREPESRTIPATTPASGVSLEVKNGRAGDQQRQSGSPSPDDQAIKQHDQQFHIQRPTRSLWMRIQDITVLSVVAGVELTWLAAVAYLLYLLAS
jgi:hypothetical protein